MKEKNVHVWYAAMVKSDAKKTDASLMTISITCTLYMITTYVTRFQKLFF